MRFISIATIAAIAVGVAASPLAAPNYGGNVAQIIGAPIHPIIGYPVPAYPGSGAGNGSNGNGNGSNGNGNGSNGNGSNGNGSNGNGSNGNGSNGNGSNGNGSNGSGGSEGQVGKPEDCGLKPGQKSALTPLVNELKLTRTVDDLKHLTKQITDLLANTLQEDATSSILNVVDSLVAGLGLGGLDLKPAVDSITSILRKQVPCLLDTLLPKP
ncbi:hypothetical protein LPJ62_006290 [Coemansia sp. RSA 2167]|nr:hypothetical protein LPJ62_006290 [Coemansia sp. RSA 2167]KAJ2134738.1 hypothetical protein GGH17_002682 [Coemansia sp. RSA 788]KAJ2164452.1 hypothetical protein GGH15_003921 [Coemansia sp. RSA 562]KAJ2194838.1 hypothetical protein GGH18_002101 [Coemansia sp. RSA 530]KAJ2270595.1 hypothetical protein J3F81_003821 [Coemansia sp. RSA 371]KAJ2284235.1 hypothetical protein GGH14_000239 [Coemansia sp. RSA 370]KAJ2291921.1 hypothetical protein IW141_002298 [Coemansia sp. RSA 355]KAJ2530317.1 hy